MGLFSRNKKVFGLDISDDYLRVVFLKEVGKGCKLQAFNQMKLKAETIKGGEIANPRRLKTALLRLLKEAVPERIKTRYAVVALPDSKVFVHVFRFPATLSEEEIKKSIPFEAENLIPFSADEVYWDYQIIRSDKKQVMADDSKKSLDKYYEVLYAAVPKTVVDKYYEVLLLAKIKPLAFTLHSDSIAQALIHAIQTSFGTLIVNLGSKVSSLTIFDHQAIESNVNIFETGEMFLKEVAAKLQVSKEEAQRLLSQKVITDQEAINILMPFYQKIAQEIHHLLDYYDKAPEHRGRIKQMIVYGESSEMPGLVDFLRTQFKKPVMRADPWDNIDVAAKLRQLLEQTVDLKKHRLVLFASSVGTGLRAILHRPFEGGINLLPNEIREVFRKGRKIFVVKVVSFAVVWFCLALLMGFGYVAGKMFFELREVNQQATSMEILMKGTRYQEIKNFVGRFNQEVATLNGIQANLYDVTEVSSLLKKQIPEKIEVTSFDFLVDGKTVVLTGIAPLREDLLNLENRFRNLEIVAKVYFPRSNLDDPENLSFSLNLVLAADKLPHKAI